MKVNVYLCGMENEELKKRVKGRIKKANKEAWFALGLFAVTLYGWLGKFSLVLFVISLLIGKTKAAMIFLCISVVSFIVITIVSVCRGGDFSNNQLL